ncbi:reverse transcriptase [Gossypium australe]|uniref:Reverse transcriptase n=1 Tax=Gossypium australe TaxID=47621 RepID=A0A5B6WSS8_9ROSI|nr:reverse transcriptase [Gossypium australe]
MLCYKVLSSKYFPSGDIFRPKVVDKPSYTWSSIAKAAKVLENDFVWLVEDGKSIDIRNDNWGFDGLNGDSLCHSLLTYNERKRVGHNILPTYVNISFIRKNFEKKCPRCDTKEETLIYTLKDCPSARAILTLEGFNNRLLVEDYSCCIDWLEDVLRVLDLKAAADLFTTF